MFTLKRLQPKVYHQLSIIANSIQETLFCRPTMCCAPGLPSGSSAAAVETTGWKVRGLNPHEQREEAGPLEKVMSRVFIYFF